MVAFVTRPPEPAPWHRGIVHGTVMAMICFVAGVVLVFSGIAPATGLVVFVLVPGVAGFVVARTLFYWRAVLVSMTIATFLCLGLLVTFGLEGLLCVLMALPLLFASALCGAAVGRVTCLLTRTPSKNSTVLFSTSAALMLLGLGQLDHAQSPRRESVTTTITIDAPPEQVWDALVNFDRVEGTQPLLMRIGLPVPLSCEVKGTGVGAERICRFDRGFIRERVTKWDAPRALEFDVLEVRLPGRHWLGFQRAGYSVKQQGDGKTEVTRTTVVTSTLRPAWYWRVFERLGTETEHHYILEHLRTTTTR